jgi:hypothetical protein
LIAGPRRKRLCANYPENLNTGGTNSEPNARKKKAKGKHREDPLQGLIRIDDSVEPPIAEQIEIEQPNSNPNGAGSSNNRSQHVSESVHQNGLVRIDMGQML